jgi:hypothetical protein
MRQPPLLLQLYRRLRSLLLRHLRHHARLLLLLRHLRQHSLRHLLLLLQGLRRDLRLLPP